MLLERPVDPLLDHVFARVETRTHDVEVYGAEYAASLKVDGGDALDVLEHQAQRGVLPTCQLSTDVDGDYGVAHLPDGGLRGTHSVLSVADTSTMLGASLLTGTYARISPETLILSLPPGWAGSRTVQLLNSRRGHDLTSFPKSMKKNGNNTIPYFCFYAQFI